MSEIHLQILTPWLFTAYNKLFTLYMPCSRCLPSSFALTYSPFNSHTAFVGSYSFSEEAANLVPYGNYITGVYVLSQNCEKRPSLSSRLPICVSVSPSVRTFVRIEQLGSHWTDFYTIWCLNTSPSPNYSEKIQFSLKHDSSNGCFACSCMYICVHLWSHLPILLGMRNVLDTRVEKFKIHIL